MSRMKVSVAVAAAVTALALSAGAAGDTGKSPNGATGPAGNPNQPAATPQANGPQGPAGNEAQGKRATAKLKSRGKLNAGHGKSRARSRPTRSHANPSPGTPRKGGREDRPAGKITICHATRSHTNPYVEITISLNGLHGHGPAEDSRHHEGSWKDIIPAPAAGCPAIAQQSTTSTQPTPTATQAAPEQAVLGARAQGSSPAQGNAAQPARSKVLGASASGTAAPKAAQAVRAENEDSGSLPFTGFELAFVLFAAAATLLGGFALRRAMAHGRS